MNDTTTFERVEVKQNRGPTLDFDGREIANTSFETRGRDPMKITMEVFETRGGALIAVSTSEPSDRPDGFADVRAAVVPPTADNQAMQFAVMDHFDWADRARSMMRKQAGWKFRLEVA